MALLEKWLKQGRNTTLAPKFQPRLRVAIFFSPLIILIHSCVLPSPLIQWSAVPCLAKMPHLDCGLPFCLLWNVKHFVKLFLLGVIFDLVKLFDMQSCFLYHWSHTPISEDRVVSRLHNLCGKLISYSLHPNIYPHSTHTV